MTRLLLLIRDLFPAKCSRHEAFMRLNGARKTEPPPTADKRTSHLKPAAQPPFKPKGFKETLC
jgi:hypothetical protein